MQDALPSAPQAPEPVHIVVLCADWCHMCRGLEEAWPTLTATLPQARWHWVDIEDETDWTDPLDIDTFPTVLLAVGDAVMHCGPAPSTPERLAPALADLYRRAREGRATGPVDAAVARLWQHLR